ncbi:DUF1775 domain-containing protein [Micromonospora siamensis]|uniref:DUF1775 domain-containing protein n=1 Tax=Micromonospora siamensis TaxID=299152 RepID=UPI001E3FFA74|nr:DUF1775 domain-containing protein [Micromonospora siamensis]
MQTYSNGDVVRWIDEPAAGQEPEHPAPVLNLITSKDDTAPAQPVAAAAQNSDDADSDGGNGTAYGIAGILLGLAGLVAGLLAYRRTNHAS